jgi:hypothetical protein
MRNTNKILVGKCEGKRPLGRLTHRGEHNIRRDLRDMGQEGMKWIHVALDMDQWW